MPKSDIVWRYIELQDKLESPSFLNRLGVYSNLLFQPIWNVIFWACYLAGLEWVGEISNMKLVLYLVTTLQVIWTSIKSWCDVLEYYNLGTTILVWKILCKDFHYVIRSKDPRHQLFRYAAGAFIMSERLPPNMV